MKEPVFPAQDGSGSRRGDTARVLRDVIIQGKAMPGRARVTPSASPHPDQRPALDVVRPVPARAAEPRPDQAASLAAAPLQSMRPAIDREYEDGLARGLAEGRRLAADEARKASEHAARAAEQQLAERSEKLKHDLTRQAQLAYQARVQNLMQILEALPGQVEERLRAAEDDMLALSFEAVCRILGDQAVTAEGLRLQLRQAVQAQRSRRLVAVHMHPEDLATLRSDSGLDASDVAPADVQWVADPSIVLGGCILQSPEGALDARLEVQLGSLRKLLLRSRAAVAAARDASGEGA